MLSDIEFHALCDELELPAEARDIAQHARTSQPTRRVGGGIRNVTARYPSRKMGVVIQAESQLELSAIYLKEHDPAVLEYYDQPPVLKLTYEAPRYQRVLYTPDFFVLEQHGIGWEEWRPEERLERRAAKYPSRYERDRQGRWHFLPGEHFAEPLGLFFRLQSSAELNPKLVRNLGLLQDYMGNHSPNLAPELVRLIHRLVKEQPGISVAQLQEDASADAVFALIAAGQLFTDLADVVLAEVERVPLFVDELTCEAHRRLSKATADVERPQALPVEAGTCVSWDGRPWRIVNAGQSTVALASDQAEWSTCHCPPSNAWSPVARS